MSANMLERASGSADYLDSAFGRSDGIVAIANSGSSTAAVKLGLVDANRFTRECLVKALIAMHDGLTIRSFATVAECVEHTEDAFDLIAYYSHDAELVPGVAFEGLTVVRQRLGEVPVIVLSDARGAEEARTIRDILAAGVQGFIPTRTTGVPVALAVIRFVYAGGTFAPLDALLATRTDRGASPQTDGPRLSGLTLRQRDVLSHLRQGKANKTIAYELGVSESTVKVHIRNIMRRMKATNRTEAVYKAQSL
jgi:DNA-binding NarL/FixJ family response regulator